MVTGAASGIGAACATALRTAGATLTLLDLPGLQLEAHAATLDAQVLPVDLADDNAVSRLRLEADILVNSAGLQRVASVNQLPLDVFRRMQAVMVTAPFALAQCVLPSMYAKGWGRLIHISSIHGRRASALKSAYVAAKHGLEGLSKVLAVESGPHGVTSNCIAPGYVRTPLVTGQIADQAQALGLDEESVIAEVMLARSSIKRLLEPEEVADAVLYLCSDAAAFVTGTSLALDGGWTAQ
ncbi:3-hydroxybutyrate dehydrogenase [Kineococcus rhizosphaerae]|uniref:3-hydroxybutyrate dehydrogenase n=1 Tax=Kineococcus rhizosphaerae TaxID=559628 RepID=A0A2T0QUR8_9ACTN|nr:3-hydroxybutyrate dehydrogenase [Kineococcus rhizosphaerae]